MPHGSQIPAIRLAEEPLPVQPHDGLVYSTSPRVGLGADGSSRWYVKDRAPGTVFAELAAYQLGRLLDLPTPAFGVWVNPLTDESWFGCLEANLRVGVPSLVEAGSISRESVLECTVFDCWIANVDRNEGGFVVDRTAADGLRLLAIDFEKSKVLNTPNRFAIPGIDARDFWPKENLGRICRGQPVPDQVCGRIAAVSEADVRSALKEAHRSMGHPSAIDWIQTSADLLIDRAARIRDITREAWNA